MERNITEEDWYKELDEDGKDNLLAVAIHCTMIIANEIPTQHAGGDFQCRHCGTCWTFYDRERSLIPANHPESCTWRIAKTTTRSMTFEDIPEIVRRDRELRYNVRT